MKQNSVTIYTLCFSLWSVWSQVWTPQEDKGRFEEKAKLGGSIGQMMCGQWGVAPLRCSRCWILTSGFNCSIVSTSSQQHYPSLYPVESTLLLPNVGKIFCFCYTLLFGGCADGSLWFHLWHGLLWHSRWSLVVPLPRINPWIINPTRIRKTNQIAT